MTVNNHTLDSDDQPILTILQGLRDGTIDPRKIRIEVRQQCVEVCYFDAPHVLPFKSQGPLQVFETSESLKFLIVEINFEAWCILASLLRVDVNG